MNAPPSPSSIPGPLAPAALLLDPAEDDSNGEEEAQEASPTMRPRPPRRVSTPLPPAVLPRGPDRAKAGGRRAGHDGEDDDDRSSARSDSGDELAWPSHAPRPAGAATAAKAAGAAAARAARVAGARERDKADRATVETVLDPRTRLTLFKLLNAGVLASMHGCISTGKEANVYHAVAGSGNGGGHARAAAAPAGPASSSTSSSQPPAPSSALPPAPPGADLAVKVYKTSILAFKDRERYVTGDFRYSRGYCKGNPRKMVRMWAEKEARNLARLAGAGVACPTVRALRGHVLVMDFIADEDGVPGAASPSSTTAAPRLKDAPGLHRRPALAASLYKDALLAMRALYARARLVHGDLSEYNMLLAGGRRLVIIDVSQAVDLDHPRAFDFLRADAAHVSAFFARLGVPPLGLREVFDFVVNPTDHGGVEGEGRVLDALLAAAVERVHGGGGGGRGERQTAEAALAGLSLEDDAAAASDAVFAAAYIPRRLLDVADHERDHDRLAAGGGAAEGIYYQALAGMTQDMTRVMQLGEDGADAGAPPGASSSSSSGSDDGSSVYTSSGSGSGSDEGGEGGSTRKRRHRQSPDAPRDPEAEKAARKTHKAAVKAAARERRKTKTPKHVKKRATKKKK